MSLGERVAITGLGAVSGFGIGVGRLWEGLIAGACAVAPVPAFADAGLPALAALVPGQDPLAPGDRAAPLALAAASEAVADAGGVAGGRRLAVSVGTTLGGIGSFLDLIRGRATTATGWRWQGPGAALARRFDARGPLSTVSMACASGNAAIGAGLDLLRRGRAEQVIAGGVDVLSDFVCAGFASLKAVDIEPCRPFDRRRRGLNLGEGAAFLVLERESDALRRGARIRAFLDGYGATSDAVHMTAPDRTGRGAAMAMGAALRDAARPAEAIDFVSAHGTATAFNDAMEAKALAIVFGARAGRVPVSSIKGAVGHTLGAAGALEALLCVRALESGTIPPTCGFAEPDPEIPLDVVHGAPRQAPLRAALSTSSGFGGVNAVLVLSRVDAGEPSGPPV